MQALLELGSLAVVDGRAVLAKVEVDPDTVQGTILARVDRLGARERTLLQHAAVIGRSFSTELIQAVVGEDEVQGSLEELARAQLLVAEGPDRWSFKHALIQEVVYETLLLRQKGMHRRVAEALEARAGEDPAFLEALAEHYAKAEVREKARHYALAAGDLASERMGFVEARARYETAFRLWGEGDEEGRLELLMKLGWARLYGGDVGAARTAYVEAEAGWKAGDVVRAGGALAGLGRVLWIAGEGERAGQALKRAIEVLEPGGPSRELLRAYLWGSTQRMLLGQTDDSVALATRGLEIAEALRLDGARSQLLNNLGVCLAQRGDPAALDRLREALELAERSGDTEALGRIYTNLPSTLAWFSRHREAVELCERGREVMRKLGAPNFEQFIAANEASCLMEMGRYEDAEALAREALEQQRVIGGVPGIVNSGMTLADSMTRRGRYEDAARLLDEVLPLARGLGGAEFLSQALAVQARLEQARGNLATARQAIAEAAQEVMATPSVSHVFVVLALAAQLLPEERTRELLHRAKPAAIDPAFQAIVAKAAAILAADRVLFAKAADLNAALELPYQEARCRLEAGELDRAAGTIDRLGIQDGPLGARLRQLRNGTAS